MKISVNNGNSFCTVKEALEKVGMEVIVSMMDDDTREAVHSELAPCTDEEFVTRYLELAPENLIIG
jgi:hypothetical protein